MKSPMDELSNNYSLGFKCRCSWIKGCHVSHSEPSDFECKRSITICSVIEHQDRERNFTDAPQTFSRIISSRILMSGWLRHFQLAFPETILSPGCSHSRKSQFARAWEVRRVKRSSPTERIIKRNKIIQIQM